jgi:ABC-type sugar transport system substrate-binding protein
MKKALAILMAALMALSLFACSGTSNSSNTTAGAGNTAAASPSAPAPASSPSQSATPAAASASPAAASAGTVGWLTDDVDPFARKQYKIVYIVSAYLQVNVNLNDCLQRLATKLNVDYRVQDARNDMDVFITTMQTYADQGYDGFILDMNPNSADRVYELATELKLNWVTAYNSCYDADGNVRWPAVTVNSHDSGAQAISYLYDNYKTYWGDIDLSKLGLILVDYSDVLDLHGRVVGAQEQFIKSVPEAGEKNIITANLVNQSVTADVAYDQTAAILAAHPQIEHWFIYTCQDLYGSGSARAVESLSMEKKALVATGDGDALIAQWDSGYNGSWVCGVYISTEYRAEPIMCGLLAMIDGRATPETLWPEAIKAGQSYPELVLKPTVITRDNYKDYLQKASTYLN